MIDPDNPHSPVNSVTLDFIGIGFSGGAQAVLNEVRRQHPNLELDINLPELRAQWAEEQSNEGRLHDFRNGQWMISHAWAYRWIAWLFEDHMDHIGAERYVAQEIDITPALPSGMKRMVICVMRGWFYDRVKGLIKEEADKIAAAAKGEAL